MLNTEQMSIFDGLMISDAGLVACKSKNANSSFRMGAKYKSFAEVPARAFPEISFGNTVYYSVFDKRTQKIYSTYRCSSRVHPFLTQQRKRWYPNGKKMVPRDIVLTPTMLLWWHIGDGYLRRNKSRPNYRRVELQTQGFVIEDINFLIEKLSELFGSESIYEENGYICIARTALCRFANMLGPESPLPEYQYKFEFGRYFDEDYFVKSFQNRPLHKMNAYRKKHSVRELDYEKVKQEFSGAKL